MLEVISRLITSIIVVLSWGYVVRMLVGKKVEIKVLNIIYFILSTAIVYTMLNLDIGFSKTLIGYLLFTIMYKIIYKIEFSKSIILVFMSIFIHFICEIILAILTTILVPEEVIHTMGITPLSGMLSFSLVIIIYNIFKNKWKKLYKMLSSDKVSNIFYVILIIFIAVLLSININDATMGNNNFIANGITIVIFLIIVIFIIKEKVTTSKINNQFNEVFNNSREVSSLLEKYRKLNHENKNDLRFIRGKSQNNKEVMDYIDDILEEKNIKDENRWISELNKINEPGINSFLSIKINSMIDEKMKIIVEISNKVKKYDFSKLTIKEQKSLCRMLGVYLDNAYQAAKNSKDKVISIEINIVDNELRIIISNTFKGKVELDKIGKYGYTTKGKEHGAGLSLVNDILEKEEIFSNDTRIINNFFFQFIFVNK